MKKVAALVLVLTAFGCGHSEDKRDENALASGGRRGRFHPGRGPGQSLDGSDIKIDNELGVVDTADVEDAIADRFEELRACYGQAGKAQRYAGGRVLLRFLVGGSGLPDDVLVAESDLGNYGVERCLVHVGRAIKFKAPQGGKATTFDFPIEFRSSGQATVLNLDGLKVEHDLSAQIHQLADCGRLADAPVAAILYIEPNGLVGSVGFSGATPLDEDTGDCMAQMIQTWHMSATLPRHVLRCNFRIPPVIASAEPPLVKNIGPLARRRRK